MAFIMGAMAVLIAQALPWAIKVIYTAWCKHRTLRRVDEEESNHIFEDLLNRIEKKPSSLASEHQEPKGKQKPTPSPPTDDPPYSSMYPERANIFRRGRRPLPPPIKPSRTTTAEDLGPTSDDIIRLPSHLPKMKSVRLEWWFSLVASYPDIEAHTPQGRQRLYEIVMAQEQERKTRQDITKSSFHIPAVETTDGVVPQARQPIQSPDATFEPEQTTSGLDCPPSAPRAQHDRAERIGGEDTSTIEPTNVGIEICETCGATRDHWAPDSTSRNDKMTINELAEQIECSNFSQGLRLSASG